MKVEKPKLIVMAGPNGSGKTSVRATNGKLEKVYSDVNNWAQSILKSLKLAIHLDH